MLQRLYDICAHLSFLFPSLPLEAPVSDGSGFCGNHRPSVFPSEKVLLKGKWGGRHSADIMAQCSNQYCILEGRRYYSLFILPATGISLHLICSKQNYQPQCCSFHIKKWHHIKTQGSAGKELYKSVRHSLQWSKNRKGKLLSIQLHSQLRGDKPIHNHGRSSRSMGSYLGDRKMRAMVLGLCRLRRACFVSQWLNKCMAGNDVKWWSCNRWLASPVKQVGAVLPC